MDKIEIPQDVVLGAQAGQARYYVPSSVAIAQWWLESGFGLHMPANSNNPFGIKAKAEEPYVSAMTWEVKDGHNIRIEQRFAKYASLADGFEAHARLLATLSLYKPAMDAWYHGRDLHAGVALMAQHYATDPSYATKLMALITGHDLVQYDSLPSDRAKLSKAAAAAGVAPASAPLPSTVAPAPDLSAIPAALGQVLSGLIPANLPGVTSPATAASPAAKQDPNMTPMTAIAIVQQVITYAPQIEGMLAKIPDMITKGEAMIAAFEKMDFSAAVTDIEGIVADLGINQSTLASIISHATGSAPPAKA